MKSPGIVQRHPELRWLASAAVLGAIAIAVSTSISGVFHSDTSLPVTSPDALIARVRAPHVGGYSGTITTNVDLGLPTELQRVLSDALPVGGDLLSPNQSHLVRYWYGSEDQQRVALRKRTAEQDVFRNGTQLLTWDTRTQIAQRSTVAASTAGGVPLSLATPLTLTPPELADRMLDLAGSSSDTTLRGGTEVADRATYELVIRPDDAASRVETVQIQIDGEQLVPLGVQIFARGASTPAVDVQFTNIAFVAPAERNFTFTPPAGVSVAQEAAPNALSTALGGVRTVGAGWSQVLRFQASAARAKLVDAVLGENLKPVKGTWGRGRLLATPLLCLLITDRGVIVAGAVAPSVLYAAVR